MKSESLVRTSTIHLLTHMDTVADVVLSQFDPNLSKYT